MDIGLLDIGLPTDRDVWTVDALAETALAEREGRIGVVGASPGATALALRAMRRIDPGRPLVVVTRSLETARALESDLRFALGPSVERILYDPGEQTPWADLAPDRRAAHHRLASLYRLGDADAPPPITIVPASALIRKVVPATQVRARAITVCPGDERDRDELLRDLIDAGYIRSPLVEDPGSLSVRGALLDVWPPGRNEPVRVELDGDEVVSLKPFDPESQRSLGKLDRLSLVPAREAPMDRAAVSRAREMLRDLCDAVDWPSSKTRQLIDDLAGGRSFFGAEGFLPTFTELAPLVAQLPEDAVLLIEEPSAVAEAVAEEQDRAERDVAAKAQKPHLPLEAFYVEDDELDAWLEGRRCVALNQNPVLGGADRALSALGYVDDQTPSIATHDQQELSRAIAAARAGAGHGASLDPLLERVEALQRAGLRVIFTARATTQAERLGLMLQNREVAVEVVLDADAVDRFLSRPSSLEEAQTAIVLVGPLARGVKAPGEGLSLITEEEVFGSRSHRRKAKVPGKRRTQQLLEDLRSLAVGEYVVHVDHGIGRYEGLIHRDVAGHTVDLLVVAYAGGDKLYLPVYRLNQVHKFRGGGEAAPKLDRLGGQTFARTKSKTRKKVREMADQLLKLYAERNNAQTAPLDAIDDEYRAFEASFPYEETEDQARAIEDVNGDLMAPRPMDRLVCGDVGFGKTEVALRAAFRVAMAGRQVAVLCPTTVLAQQHKLTFDARLGAYPIELAVMSRFQSKKRLDETVRKLRDGQVDIAIGTHRLLSKDVHFKNLGLLVIDEEQRFGVAAKERLKQLRNDVDVLTLTATPIPRTLQMSVSGLRDMSVMTTPPVDRRAVRTIVTRHDATVLREALERELGRGGQAFFVYNRVGGLEERAALVHELLPGARIAVAHGQMTERSLEKTMLEFVDGRFDILVTTAIIENGLDIPRANTIIIDRADLFGLGQLYQLRGRVGRSKERGYCYLVLPPGGSVTADARVRLEAMQRYSELGSGFQVASLDLDVRGAGDLLGADQSGAVATVGLEMFCHMLEEASAELRGEHVVHEVDPELSFDVEALLPESYVPDVGVRLSLYKRLASALDESEVETLSEEMQDRFGRPPPEARRFVHLMTLKTELRSLRVLACEASAKSVTWHLRDDTPLDPIGLTAFIAKSKVKYRLTPDMRLSRKSRDGEVFASGLEATARMLTEVRSALRSA